MAAWAVANIKQWPLFPSSVDADPDDINCEFVHFNGMGSLPVLRCRLGGGFISSSDYFYAKRGIKNTS